MEHRPAAYGDKTPRPQAADHPKPPDRASLLRRLRRETDPPQQPCARQVSGRRFVCSATASLPRLYMHYIPTAKMEAAILAAIQRVSWYVRTMKRSLSSVCGKRPTSTQENAVKEYRQKVSKAQRRCKELDGLVRSYTRATPQARYPISTLPVCLPNTTRNRPGWKPLSHNGRKQSRAGTPTG